MPSWLWIQNVVFPILGMGMGALFMVGVYKTANRWLDRRHEREMMEHGMGGGDLRELHGRLEVLDDVMLRLQDLEERVDFAERMLARHDPEGRQLGRGG